MTNVLKADTAAARGRAVELLRNGEPVALPTETVYGLAADALNAIAVAKIFEAKSRPSFDPLIVHLPDTAWLEKISDVPARDRSSVAKLGQEFWPGPLTMVLPKREIVPAIVTAGLDTVAVRISAHPVFAEIVREFGRPLAAPSANRFGRISPTTSQHVFDELNGRIPLIIDAGPARHGIESTIVAIQDGKIEILRRGPITLEQLRSMGFEAVAPEQKADATKISWPGQLPSHYAPKTPLQLIDDAESFVLKKNQRVALLAWNSSRGGDCTLSAVAEAADETKRRSASFAELRRAKGDRRSSEFVAIRQLSESQDLREAAANLFRYLRELDGLDVDLIVAERVPAQGLGAAIMDRLTRAAHDSPDKPGKLQ